MSCVTGSEVEDALKATDEYFYWSDLAYEDFDFDSLIIHGVSYPFEVVSSRGGEEGDWDIDTFIIMRVGDQVFRKTGHYQSHVGSDWDGPVEEVFPVEKTITAWEKR